MKIKLFQQILERGSIFNKNVFQISGYFLNLMTVFSKKNAIFFDSNISLVRKDIRMNTWIQIFNILISLSYFVLFFTFFKTGNLSSLESLGNGLLLLYLGTSNLQQIYSSWMTFRKSKNAISYIEDERHLTPH